MRKSIYDQYSLKFFDLGVPVENCKNFVKLNKFKGFGALRSSWEALKGFPPLRDGGPKRTLKGKAERGLPPLRDPGSKRTVKGGS